MKQGKLCLLLMVVCLLFARGIGFTETMYVSDRLYLSLRNAPDPEQPALDLLSSDTKVDVLETQGHWARVRLEDGKTGWVWKRYLVEDVPKSLIIEHLKRQIEDKDVLTERLREEIATLKKEVDTLTSQISQQNERFEVTTKESSGKRLKGIYVIGIVALFVGFALGYLIKRPKTTGYSLPPTHGDSR